MTREERQQHIFCQYYILFDSVRQKVFQLGFIVLKLKINTTVNKETKIKEGTPK